MASTNITNLVVIVTLIFLIAPAFLLLYIAVYNRRKKKHQDEKVQMKLAFETEMIKTQLEVQEQTMQTIGADLHDNVGQLLSLMSLTLKSIELDDLNKAGYKIDTAIDLTLRAIKEMRLLGKLLQGDQLIAQGLANAIRNETDWLERSGHYKISYTCNSEQAPAKHPDKDLVIFRILQEVLNNIIKHARATEISIRLYYLKDEWQLTVKDNGVGFNLADIPAQQRGAGLHNIQKRAAIIGGSCMVESVPGSGTGINIYIPYP